MISCWRKLRLKKMAYEKECDIVLGILANRLPTGIETLRLNISKELEKHIEIEADGVEYLFLTDRVLSILKNDGFIIGINETYKITDKGTAFYFTDSYIQRAKRWDIENKTKRFLYKYRWATWVVSFSSMIISLAAYFKPSETQIKILPMQEKKCPEELRYPILQAEHQANTQNKDTPKR